jgi:hypothetical protein
MMKRMDQLMAEIAKLRENEPPLKA